MKGDKLYVLDSWAILAYFNGESAAEKVADVIADAKESDIPLLMSFINLGEVWYIIARRLSYKDADEAVAILEQFGVKFVDADIANARGAATFKAKGKISYADCYAAALAEERGASLITGDREFAQFKDRIKILWMT